MTSIQTIPELAIKGIIFYQRKLKPQEVGRCTLIPEETRISKSLPSFQRFRIYQELANLFWLDREGKAHPVTSSLEARDALFNELEAKRKASFVSWSGKAMMLSV